MRVVSVKKGFLLVTLSFIFVLYQLSCPPQIQAASSANPQRESLGNKFKEEELIPVLTLMRKYSQRRPDLFRLLNSAQIIVPGFYSDPGASSFKIEGYYIVSINLDLLLDYTALSELVALSVAAHPRFESIYQQTLSYYETFLSAFRPGLGAEGYLIISNVRRFLSDATEIDYNQEMGKIIRRDIIAWVVLHEISHHILKHTSQKQLSLSEKRNAELAADLSAAKLLNELGLNLTYVKSFLQVKARMEPVLIQNGYQADEDKSDHPSWTTRFNALKDYMDHNPPIQNAWIGFGGEKFVEEELLDRENKKLIKTGKYELTQMHFLFPADPASWSHRGFDIPARHEFGQWVHAIAVSFENGQAHLYWRSDVFLNHVIIESPYTYTSRITFSITTIANGKKYDAQTILNRDSAFRWHQSNKSFHGIPLVEVQSVSQGALMLKHLSEIVEDKSVLSLAERIINQVVKSEGELFLDYMRGEISRERYAEALRISASKMADELTPLIGKDRSDRFISAELKNPLYRSDIGE